MTCLVYLGLNDITIASPVYRVLSDNSNVMSGHDTIIQEYILFFWKWDHGDNTNLVMLTFLISQRSPLRLSCTLYRQARTKRKPWERGYIDCIRIPGYTVIHVQNLSLCRSASTADHEINFNETGLRFTEGVRWRQWKWFHGRGRSPRTILWFLVIFKDRRIIIIW